MSKVFPSIEEILPPELQARVPENLAATIRQRYELLGPKYVTEELYVDGRFVNGCMNTLSVQEGLEEIVDAVFNTLVWLFKVRLEGGHRSGESAYSALVGLIELYNLFFVERQNDDCL